MLKHIRAIAAPVAGPVTQTQNSPDPDHAPQLVREPEEQGPPIDMYGTELYRDTRSSCRRRHDSYD